jgi:hypothetical protein
LTAPAAHLMAQVRARAVEAAAAGPPEPPDAALYRRFATTGDRLGYETVYFDRRGRLVALLAAALHGGEPEVHGALGEHLSSVCDEYTWALPAHERYALDGDMRRCVDLFACETAHTLAEAVRLLGDRLPPAVPRRVCAQVRERVLDPLFASGRELPWERFTNNWAAVCAGAAGMAALALGDDPHAVLRRLDAPLRRFLSGFTPDGGCAEGALYWAYGFGYFTYFAEALRERAGIDLLTGEHARLIRAVAAFPAAVDFGGGRCASFSDAAERVAWPTGLLSRLHARLGTPVPEVSGIPDFDADPCHRWAYLSRDLWWTDPAILGGPAPHGTSWLPDLAWVVDRRPLGATTAVFAAKGGHNDEPHNHNDLGSFILALGGEQLLADLGAGEYTADYFDAGRYASLYTSSAGHSVPVVAGREQRTGAAARARVIAVDRHPDGVDLALDLSTAYGEDVAVRRHFVWRAGGTLALRDAASVPLEEIFISRRCPTLGAGAATWSGAAGAATLHFPGGGWRAAVEAVPAVDHEGRPETVYRLRLRGGGPGEHAFRFALSAG